MLCWIVDVQILGSLALREEGVLISAVQGLWPDESLQDMTSN